MTTLIKAKLALWEAAEVVEDFIGFKVKADDSDGTLGWYCVWLGEIEDVKASHALGLIAAFREAEKGEGNASESGVGGRRNGDDQSQADTVGRVNGG